MQLFDTCTFQNHLKKWNKLISNNRHVHAQAIDRRKRLNFLLKSASSVYEFMNNSEN